MRKSHDEIVLTFTSVARIVVLVCRRYYIFYMRFHYYFAKK